MHEHEPHHSPVGPAPQPGVPTVGPVPSPGVSSVGVPKRLRRLHRVTPDRDGNISYLLTLCTEQRARILATNEILDRLVAFLSDSPTRYGWFGRRFVLMPDHLHLIAHQGGNAAPLGQWVKALKAVVGGAIAREQTQPNNIVGPVPPPGVPPAARAPSLGVRTNRRWRWQTGYHDHKFRTRESESRKWEYICLNPVRAGLVKHPEEWPFGGEVFYEGPTSHFAAGVPPLLKAGILIDEA